MPQAPKRRHLPRPPRLETKPPERRCSASERGYSHAWTKYADALRREVVFCAICIELGIETPCAGQTTTETGRKRSQGVVDHVVPPRDSEDVLFWMPENHWCLCQAHNSEKSLQWDGTYGKRKIPASSRDLAGVERRKREIIAAMRLSARDATERIPE